MIKLIKTVLFLLLFFSYSLCSSYYLVEAQEATRSSEYILQKERLAEEIDNTKDELIVQLEQYQQDYKQYQISISQYENLQTLNSIEEAVKASKRAMISRNKVLVTYLNLMKLKLIEAEGVEVVHKETALDEIEAHLNILEDFEDKISKIEDRDTLSAVAGEFEPQGSAIRETGYYVLSMLAIGRLQATYDQAFAIEQKIEQKDVSDLTKLEQAERERAIREVKKLVSSLPPEFEDLWLNLSNSSGNLYSYQGFYRGISDDLNPIYSQLSQLVSYLEELEQIK